MQAVKEAMKQTREAVPLSTLIPYLFSFFFTRDVNSNKTHNDSAKRTLKAHSISMAPSNIRNPD